MPELKRYVELSHNKSDLKFVISLDDIVNIQEELWNEGRDETFKEYKAIRITTVQRDSYLCDYSHYEMLKHYLCNWDDVPSYIKMGLKENNNGIL
jgi:hypothetical protein